MKYTLQDQIRAVQTAMRGASMLVLDEDIPEFAGALNDAGSTLAYLNLTKDLPEKDEYLDKLCPLVCDIVAIVSERANVSNIRELVEKEAALKLEILAMSYDRLKLQEDRIKDLEEALNDNCNHMFVEARDITLKDGYVCVHCHLYKPKPES